MVTTNSSRYRSLTEYRFEADDQTDAIIRTVGYHREDFCRGTIWFPPEERIDVHVSKATTQRISSAGTLDRLPLELLYDTLLSLDMRSLLSVRQSSYALKQTVDSLKQFGMVLSHGMNMFCALLRTGLDTSLSEFYDVLCRKSCTLCGEFGGFVSLLTWKRACLQCILQAPELRVMTLASLRKHLCLTKTELTKVKAFKTLPGDYTESKAVQSKRVAIASIQQIVSACGRTWDDMEGCAEPALGFDKLNYMGSCMLPSYDKQSNQVEYGMCCAGCQLAVAKSLVDTRVEGWIRRVRNKVYTSEGLLEHFKWCEQAQILWMSSDGGRARPSELPYIVRREMFCDRSHHTRTHK